MIHFLEISWFFGALFIYFLGYRTVNLLYKQNEYYNQLKKDRKLYFQKNIVKFYSLLFISVIGTPILYNGLIENNWDNLQIYRIGYLYSTLDFMGLLFVKNLPMNSKMHHLTTIFLSYLNTYVDYNEKSFWIGLPVYCILSCYACFVNYFLAMRLINPLDRLGNLIRFNLVSYVILLLLNWIFQFYIFLNRVGMDINFYSGLYAVLIIVVASDDVKLVKFLYHHLKKLDKNELLPIYEN